MATTFCALTSPPAASAAHYALDVDADLKDKLRAGSRASSLSIRSLDHENRFLSDDERLLASNPLETRRSFAALNDQDRDSWHALPLTEVAQRLKTDSQKKCGE